MRSAKAGMVIGVGLALAACSRSNDTSAPAATMGTVGTTSAGSASAAASSAQATAVVDAAPNGAGSWTGHYTASPGPLFVPDGGEWAGVRFRGEDASVGLGDGTLKLVVDPLGHLQGSLDGALGALQVYGELTDGAFAATLVSADPGSGFAGTAVGRAEGDHITGTMRLSLPTGNVIREAPFTLDRRR